MTHAPEMQAKATDSAINASVSIFAAAIGWLSTAHVWLSIGSLLVAIIAGIFAIRSSVAATRLRELEIEKLLSEHCRNCGGPDNCPFKREHRPESCKHSTKL